MFKKRLYALGTKALTLLLVTVGVGVVGYGLWLSGDFVSAYLEEKEAHIFGTSVTARGWTNETNVLQQDVSANDPLAGFTENNSAFIVIKKTPSEAALDEESDPTFAEEPVEVDAPSEPEVEASAPDDTTEEASVPEESIQDAPEENVPAEVVPEEVPTDAVPPPDTTTDTDVDVPPTSLGESNDSLLSLLGSYVSRKSAPAVFAATTESEESESSSEILEETEPASTEPVEAETKTFSGVPDPALCEILERDCYTVLISGFTPGEALSEKRFEGVSLAFSFGAVAEGDADIDDRLLVRYYHEGAWKQSGELFLNKEISNAAHGGYFVTALPEVTSWADVGEMKIVVEYVRENDGPIELYLDSAWFIARYKDRAQDILAGDDALSETGNVAFETVEHEPGLVLSDGTTIHFPFTDDAGEDSLVIRSSVRTLFGVGHKPVGGQPMSDSEDGFLYISIENTTDTPDAFRLAGAFPDGAGTIAVLEQYVRNVPVSHEEAIHGDVTYFCESGWTTSSTDATPFMCADTEEEHACDELDETGVHCLVTGDVVGTEEKREYESRWIPVPTTAESAGGVVSPDMLPPGFVISDASAETITILPGQTLYFRLRFDTKDAGVQRFVLYAKGGALFGDLESALLADDASFAEMRVKKAKPVSKANSRISTRTNFEGDETPEFTFKFKSRRGVFERATDMLLGRDAFTVDRATLKDPSGKEGAADVEVLYGENGEWSLALKNRPRAFRPGKYEMEITLNDGGTEYTETVAFYWGVLAVNTNKSIYELGETAQLSLAALDDVGNTLCDAALDLRVTTPSGSEAQVPVSTSGECGYNNIVLVADYLAEYPVVELGTHRVVLTELDDAGAIIHRIEDSFDARENVSFVVERRGPTRIFPKAPYQMELTISARRDFSGTIHEPLPKGFVVLDTAGGELKQFGDTLELFWNVSLAAGETKTIRYEFDAPDVSPYLYVLGPLSLREGESTAFEETRSWKIASDALGDIGHWRDSVGGQIAGTSFVGFDFDAQVRNDGIYSRPNDSTIEFDEAGDYLVIATIRGNDTSNGRTNLQSRVQLTSGTGTLFTSYYTGYARDTSEDDYWTRAVGVVLGASANSQIEVQTRRDADTPTGGSVVNASDVQVVRLNFTNYGVYAIGGTGNSLGGTSPNTVDVSAVTSESDTSAIEGSTSTDTITVKGDNKRYLLAWSVSGSTGGSRTQRIGHVEYDGVDDLATRSYCYQRDAANEYCGIGSMDLIETASTDRAIQVEVFRGPGVAADNGGADVDGSFVTDGNGQMIIVELPDSMEVFRSHDSTGLQTVTSAVTLNAMRNVDFNDSGSFTQGSNSAMNVVNTGDVMVWANVFTARNDISTGNRFTGLGSITVNGVEQTTGTHGNYTRGNQGTEDTFGGSFHPAGIFTIGTAGHDIGINMDPLSGTEGGGTDRTQAGTVGFFALNLDLNNPPAAPTLYDAPFESEKSGTSTPSFLFSATDPDGSSDVVYQFQWDDDPVLDDNPIGDRSSDNESGCSPNCFENLTTPSDTSPFTEGNQIEFTIQTPLVSGTTYYWRVRATDVTGSNTAGEWSDVLSYTYVANTDPSQWFQTEDTQFDNGTFSNTETYGSDAVRLTTSAPTEAMVAYGEGTVTTPRYRIWDGSTWGLESSAQDVGGTVQWVVTKAAPTRDEYILGTQDASSDVNVQVYDGAAGTWGDLQEVTTGISDTTARGFDVAYEHTSGDAVVVYCDGDADPSYYVWNGTGWTSGGTINLGSANNCEWVKLASNPTSDEIVMIARDTGAQYEAQVWNGSGWGNSVTLGSMNQVAHEGMAVEYEESGDQAVVVASNGTTSGFVWVSWSPSTLEWSTPTTQTLDDDFEWGVLRQDDGTDQLALCYADEDDDLGSLIWDGAGWATFAAGTNEFEGTGTTNNRAGSGTIEGRPVTCEFETTTGRDGYVMIPYSDNTAARYQYWNGSSHSGEASVLSVTDSWTVASARTGAGAILALYHDDINSIYEFARWDGASWGAGQALENSPSVTAAPFREAYGMSAQIYQSNLGTITSDPVMFNFAQNQNTWGELVWNTTEPSGTDVVFQVLYESGGSCSSLVPDGVLSGNSTGFQVSASPLDISSLSTTTYDGLCLRATLSSTNTNTPTLDDWKLSWEREAYLTQSHFRWYVNTASLTPTDPWPAGGTDVGEDSALSDENAPSFGSVLRLRAAVQSGNVALSGSALSLRLQYAAGASCAADMNWRDVGAIGSTTALWRGYDVSSVSGGTTLPSVVLANSDVEATFEEENDSSLNPNGANANEELEWDWAIEHRAVAGANYCFRLITADNEVLNAYSMYPSLTTNDAPNAPNAEKPFDNEATASTTPWFEFSGEDPEGDDVTYQVQIDDTYDFSSTVLDRDSQTNFSEFSNVTTPSDKDPFTSGQTVRFIPTTALTDGTTYYWRVRAKDRNNSNEWGDWSSVSSVTINTGVAITTWHQTTEEQFDTGSFDDTESTASDDVILSTSFTVGTTTGSAIDFDSLTTGNAWGALSWTDNETNGDIRYHVEYLNGSSWELIPDSDLSGNSAGFGTSPVSLLALSPTTYNQIRARANFTDIGGTPRLLDWTISWGLAVEEPTLLSLFDNEKMATTTPAFTFFSTDPQGDDLVYELSISQTTDFAASTTRRSGVHAGFSNTASSTDISPFNDGDTIQFNLQPGDALTNSTTYWWRARAIDPSGGNTWSTWSSLRSLTVDTGINVSTWFQTTDEQFETDTLSDTETTGSDSVRVTSTIREAFMAYAEGTTQAPRYRIWNGTTWGGEGSGQTVGNVIRFVEAAAAPTRDEYAVGTLNASGDVDVQIYNGTTDSFGTPVEIEDNITDLLSRAFDVAYETSSGDLLAVSCDGSEALYRVWNGTSWTATSTITLSVTGACEWIRLASDPTSDEIIMVVRDDISGATDYEALVWSGSSWGNSSTFGSQVTASNEGISVEYEESGGQVLVVVSNGNASNFVYNTWNGSSWTGTNTIVIGNDFAGGYLARDVGTDRLALCYIDVDADIGFLEWGGSSWTTSFAEIETAGNSANGRPIDCAFETQGSRDGYLMMPYSDTVQAEYVYWTGSGAPSSPVTLSTITDSWEVRTARTGDGNVLSVFYDDTNTEYDFSYWDGTSWASEQVIDTNSIATLTPRPVPLDVVARVYPSFTSGVVYSPSIDFDDGAGPKWEEVLFSDTTPGSSDILYQVEYYATSTETWALVPNSALSGNSSGFGTSPIDISGLSRILYNQIRTRANLACVSGNCPTLNDWTVRWAEGITVSGTATAYDQTTPLSSGTVAIAVNGTLQSGKTGTISAGMWSMPNVTVFAGDVVTVWISGAADSGEAVAITKYDDESDITGMVLSERHLSLGSNDNQTITNADIGQYDNSVSGNEDIFYDVDAGNDLTVCVLSGCEDAELFILSGNTFQPDSSSGGTVTTHDIEINGTLVANGNTLYVSGSWDNNATFTAGTSIVVFTATSGTETIDSTGSASAAFSAVTFGQGSGSATWNLLSALDINGTTAVTHGTLAMNGNNAITLAGNFTVNANGVFSKGTATTTFDSSGTHTWTDNTSAKQDMGAILVDGATKTILLGSSVKATDITIGADDTLNVNGAYTLEVSGNWTNNNVFTPSTGTVSFISTVTGRTISAGSSSFYNLTFDGVGGNWAFSGSTLGVTNNFTVTNGTVTLPTATTTVGGNFTNSGGTFLHNNGALLMNGSSAKTITANGSSFYDLAFNGTGSWVFTETNATSSRNVTITAGAVTLPSGTFAIGGSFARDGGSFTHNSGILKFIASSLRTLFFNGTSVNTLIFNGVGGSWAFTDTSATVLSHVSILNGTLTLPSNTLTIGGSFLNLGTFTHNSGTVLMNSTDTGETINPGLSPFRDLTLNSTGGGWTLSGLASTTGNFTLTNATSFTLSPGSILEVQGTFTNSVGGSATDWTGATLYLNSGTSYSMNTKSTGGDTYGILEVGASTDIRAWNSTASSIIVNATGSLYSQDHAAVDGSLYIYGEYVRSTGADYWSYVTDFDGAGIAGSPRAVTVRVATSSSITSSGGTLQIVGTGTATTTIRNTGDTGTYSFSVTGGTLNAQYYSFRHLGASGLNLSGTPTITSLSNGDFELFTEGGTMMTVSGSVIDANTEDQIQQTSFATSTGITSGANVTVTGTPASYWWFRNHYGNYDGESFDSDPGGNPGNARWDDSGFSISVSGTVYSNQGTTPMGSPTCDGVTPVVTVVVDGASSFSAPCDSGDGDYTVSNVTFTGDVVLTVYLNTNGGARAVTVTQTPSGNLTGINLYQGSTIVRHEDTAPLTISDMAVFDATDDADVLFTATLGSPNTLTTEPESELYIQAGDTFAPGGNVVLDSGGSGNALDGRLFIASGGTFTSTGTESHTIGGGMTVSTGGTFTPANSTVTFTATTTGKSIVSINPLTFYNLIFNGSGGGWSFDSAGTATTTIQNTFSVSSGTISGTGDIVVEAGDIAGSGNVQMTGGTMQLETTGSFGNSNQWQFNNLTIGDGAASGVTTNAAPATTSVLGVLRVAANQTLLAGSAPWLLSGSGTPFVVSGVYTAETAPFTFSGTFATTIADEAYASLTLSPSSGSPTYTLQGGTLSATNMALGTGGGTVTVNANTNDPSVSLSEDFVINAGSTFLASNSGAFQISGSFLNLGTFTHNSGTILLNSGDTGETVNPGSSSFYNLTLNSAGGGWTVTENATTTGNFTITNATSFTLDSGRTMEVLGTFTNSVGGSATTWVNSTLYLNSATAYSMNGKTTGGDTYGTLRIGANTDIRSWNTTADTITVNATGSLYSQDHAAVDGSLYIYGEYVRSTGADYWSYVTDFDGADISGTPREASVRIATSSSLSFSGGILDILGASTATTTIQTTGDTGTYSFSVTGGTLNAEYYAFRNLNSSGLSLSGTPTITSLSNGDFELASEGGTSVTVAGSVIDQNPLKIFTTNRFATSTGITSGTNVTVTGTSASSWKFNLHYGNFAGEAYDTDPAGDPGYMRWDDSNSAVTVSGNVYSDEGSTVSTVCDGSTPVVRLRVQGGGSYFVSCNSGNGGYTISNVTFNPGDTLTLYLDTNGGRRAANISVDPLTNISSMHLYENRVIVRHEDTAPLTIADMAVYDSDDDADIPYDATDSTTDTVVVEPETKLIVWTGKTFAPAGEVTLQSGGSGAAYDGTLELLANATFSASGTQTHSLGGSLIVGSGATLTNANSTFMFFATTTGKTIALSGGSFYDLEFDGIGGNWSFSGGSATTTNDFTITNGTVTLPTGVMNVGGSFVNTGGAFMHNNGTLVLSSTATGKNIHANDSDFYNLTLNGSGGAWTFIDTLATTTNNFTISVGSTTAPANTLAIGGSFDVSGGTFNHNGSLIRLFASASGKIVNTGTSALARLSFDGAGGGWAFTNANATTTGSVTIAQGSVTLPSGTLAIGGSFENSGSFTHNSGTVLFNSSDTGESIVLGSSPLNRLTINGSGGGWTLSGMASTTSHFTLTAATSFTLAPSAVLEVQGTFTNSVGGSATSWDSATLYLNSGTAYSMNTKSAGSDTYGILEVGPATDVRSWDSTAASIIVNATGSLYSQDDAGVSGALSIYGEYVRSTGSDYWSYATDFDGTALGGSSRAVTVRIATSSSITSSGGTLQIVGTGTATTTVRNTGDTGTYSFSVTGGTLNAQYYAFRNLNSSGLSLSGTPTITSLSNGDFELFTEGGTMMTVASTTIDTNASKQIDYVRFATSTGITSGTNVTLSGTPVGAWNFNFHSGVFAGEAYDSDGGDTCGFIRWDDSACLFVSQEHFRFRNDDGGEGAPDSEWYNSSWSKRKKIGITNNTASAFTDTPVKLVVSYDSDMQSDFDDLRFTDSSGTTLTDYWIEEKTASTEATVWVSVPSLPASGSATLYMYYGNASVTDAGDGDATFGFFDDFEDDNISEYSGNTSLFDVDTAFNYTYTYGLDAGTNVDQKTTTGMYRTGSLVAQGDTIRYFQYVDATADDEPCTLFGVQSAGQNYAVCLDQYPVDNVAIAENVTSNDESGTVLASTTVSFTSGWYEVEIDWRTNNAIEVTVYDDTGSVFASDSYTDSSYTSGGIGFSYWFQYGGWDYVASRDYMSSEPSYTFGLEQDDGGATWKAAEDTAISGIETGDDLRLRFSVLNSGAPIFGQLFRLQVASKGASASCEAVPSVSYNDVPTVSGGCGSSPACVITSSQFTNGAGTTPLLTYPASYAFAAGGMVESPSNQTASTTVSTNGATEIEYMFELTANATEDAYCFRTSDGGLELDNYSRVPEIALTFPPILSAFSLNNDAPITLTEGATTTIIASSTVTDLNGYADISFATSTMYRSDLGSACSQDENNCYQIPAPQCSLTNCAGNSCTLSCSADIQYFADATDAGAYSASTWLAGISVEDSSGKRDTVTTAAVELLTLFGLSVDASIDFGALEVGQNTGATNEQTTVVNTGNSNIDIELEGTDLTASGSSIPVAQQKYATTTFTYSSCSICGFLSGSATPVEVDLPKATSSTTPITDDLYWGINVPTGTKADTHSGLNTFWATSD